MFFNDKSDWSEIVGDQKSHLLIDSYEEYHKRKEWADGYEDYHGRGLGSGTLEEAQVGDGRDSSEEGEEEVDLLGREQVLD